jgi:hypothetical protein
MSARSYALDDKWLIALFGRRREWGFSAGDILRYLNLENGDMNTEKYNDGMAIRRAAMSIRI